MMDGKLQGLVAAIANLNIQLKKELSQSRENQVLIFLQEPLKVYTNKQTSTGRIKMRYAVVIEKGESSYGAYVPDLPGCVAVGESRNEVLALIREAIEFHLEGMKKEGEKLPEPHSETEYVEVLTA